MAGNFYDTYPGAVGLDATAISLVSDKAITALTGYSDDYKNMRVYWDGDLLDEFMDSPGVEKSPCVYKAPGQKEVGTGRSYPDSRCWMGQGNLNNSSKNNPCFLGDILGDWREEIVSRTSDKLIIQISSYPSPHGITTLWADHEYRNAMTWQSVGYNQPPHPSFFLGEMEGITKEPPANTLEGRTEVENGSTIGTTDAHLLISGYENKTVSVADGAQPYILTVNAPAWVKGSGSRQATSSTPKLPTQTVETYTTTLTGGAFSGSTRIIKQGEGVLVLPNVIEKHTGETNVWQGTLVFDGTMESSPVWLNRHTTLISNGGNFNGGLKADYNATIYPGGKDNVGSITTSTLALGFGSRIVFDGSAGKFDKVNATSLSIEAKTDEEWISFGPRYKTPVIQINYSGTLEAGSYELGTIGSVTGNISDLLIEGLESSVKTSLSYEDGKLMLVVNNMRPAGEVLWSGTSDNNVWQQAVSENFLYEGETSVMATGDDVVFNDDAASTDVVIKGAVHPNSVTFNNETKSYTISGDSIVGDKLTINGAGGVNFNNWNRVLSTEINAGKVTVSMLANSSGQTWGSLGKTASPISLNDGVTLVTDGIIITDQSLKISGEVNLEVPSGKSVIFNKAIKGSGAVLNKLGAGSMELGTLVNTFAKLVIRNGVVTSNYSSSNVETLPGTVEFYNGTLWGANMEGGSGVSNSTNFVVPAKRTGSFYSSFRGTYTGKLTGAGTFNVYTGGVRAYFNGDWSEFEGTINIGKNNRQNKKQYDPEFLLGNSKGMPLAVVNVNENARLQNQGNNINVKKFGGKGALVGTGQWIVNCDENFTLTTEVGITYERKDDYGNTIAVSASPLTKNGTGRMTITPGNLNGVLTINDGKVTFNEKDLSTLVNGKYQTYVNKSGRLVGQGYLNGITVQNGGEIKPCGSTSFETTAGTIKCATTIRINEGSTATFIIRSATMNSAFETKNLVFNGTLKIEMNSGLTPASGQQWTLWTVTNTLQSAITKYELPELPDGLYWDISGLQEKTGVISITDNPAVGFKLPTADVDPYNVYDLQGRFVLRATTPNSVEGLPSGIYIRAGKKFVVK
jgi:autotransporter-associated beta strand protein